MSNNALTITQTPADALTELEQQVLSKQRRAAEQAWQLATDTAAGQRPDPDALAAVLDTAGMTFDAWRAWVQLARERATWRAAYLAGPAARDEYDGLTAALADLQEQRKKVTEEFNHREQKIRGAIHAAHIKLLNSGTAEENLLKQCPFEWYTKERQSLREQTNTLSKERNVLENEIKRLENELIPNLTRRLENLKAEKTHAEFWGSPPENVLQAIADAERRLAEAKLQLEEKRAAVAAKLAALDDANKQLAQLEAQMVQI